MGREIFIKEAPIEEVVIVNSKVIEIIEQGNPSRREHFEERYSDKAKLIIVAYINEKPVGYIVGYDRYNETAS